MMLCIFLRNVALLSCSRSLSGYRSLLELYMIDTMVSVRHHWSR